MLVSKLRAVRIELLKKNIRKKREKKTRVIKPLKFESLELESIFNTMSPACQKLMAKAIRYKEKNK